MAWIQQNGAYVQFFIQLAFYVVIAVCAVAATLTFNKLTSAKIEADNALIDLYREADEYSEAELDETPDVSKFVD